MKTGKARLTVSNAEVRGPTSMATLRHLIAGMDYYAYLGDRWGSPKPEYGLYWLCWEKLKEWETPQQFVAAHSNAYQELVDSDELLELYNDKDALPADLSLFYLDETGMLSVMEDAEVDANLSELLVHVLSDFIAAGALFEVRPSDEANPEVWAYRVLGCGKIESLSLAWVNSEHQWVGPYVPT